MQVSKIVYTWCIQVRYIAEIIVCIDCLTNVILLLQEVHAQGPLPFIKNQVSVLLTLLPPTLVAVVNVFNQHSQSLTCYCCECVQSTLTITNMILLLQASAPAKFIFNISCVIVLLCIPMRFGGVENGERVLLAFAAPSSWAILLFFAR